MSSASQTKSKFSTAAKWTAFSTAIGAIILIGTEIWIVAAALIWAIHGFFKLATIGDIITALIIVPPALWATWQTAKLAFSAELNPENAD